jgi:hypothetical protein
MSVIIKKAQMLWKKKAVLKMGLGALSNQINSNK